MADIERTARHVLVEERAEVALFAAELKRLFNTVGLTLGQFCATSQGIIDKGSLSRYLTGKRVPRERWLLDRLFALRVKASTPLTEEAQGHLIDLQLAALEVAHPHDYKVRRVTDQLDVALTARRESERHVNRLETELTGRERRLADLTADNAQMRADWDADRDRLNREIAELISQLNLAHERRAAAEARCADLEDLLDRLQSGAAAQLLTREDLPAIALELDLIRRAGLLREPRQPLKALVRACQILFGASQAAAIPERELVKRAVQAAVHRLEASLQEAASYTWGLHAGTLDWSAHDRRKRAAAVYGITSGTFRKSRERQIVDHVAETIVLLCLEASAPSGLHATPILRQETRPN